MLRITGSRPTRFVAMATAAAVCFPASSLVGGGSAAAASAATPAGPSLALVAAAPAVTVERRQGQPRTSLDLGTHVVAERSAFEVRVTRRSYHDPIVAKQIVRDHGRVRTRTLGSDLVQDFGGFLGFLRLTVTDGAGATVVDTTQDFCPNGHTLRLRPDAPDQSPYPPSCPRHPFVLGSVWGVQAGWGTATADPFQRVDTATMPDGRYTARLAVTQPYRNAFAISAAEVTVDLNLVTVPPQSPAHSHADPPNGIEPVGPARAPHRSRPDLVPLPAFAIDILGDNTGTPIVEPERLTFAATVWNAGPSPLVVEGFRRVDEAVMDSYQYFFDSDGDRTGFAPVGSMEWDTREEHHHWHFRDFAGYRLLDRAGREVVRSQKEAFCLANTDAINLFIPDAEWQPDNTDLHSSCGTADSLTVRQALATGHGDSYPNSAPGRALEITGVPNGTYYIQITANPEHHLYETRPDNNTSLRRVILGGEPGSRTVLVPPFGLIDTDPSG